MRAYTTTGCAGFQPSDSYELKGYYQELIGRYFNDVIQW
jgi:hypothetical protein